MAESYHFQQFTTSVIILKFAIYSLSKVFFANKPPRSVADVYDIFAQLAAQLRKLFLRNGLYVGGSMDPIKNFQFRLSSCVCIYGADRRGSRPSARRSAAWCKTACFYIIAKRARFYNSKAGAEMPKIMHHIRKYSYIPCMR